MLVLDPTPSTRLDDLSAEFEKYGGAAFIGDAAWDHIEAEAGASMGIFVEKYVQTPISSMDENAKALNDLELSFDNESGRLKIRLGDTNRVIEREASGGDPDDDVGNV